MSLTFPYKAVPSALFGVVYRPVADVLVRCKGGEEWVSITMIVDTGADYTLLPKRYAALLDIDLDADYTKHATHGVGGSETVYLCRDVAVKLGRWERYIPLAFLDRDDVPPLLGRQDFFQTFKVTFHRHETTFVQPRRPRTS